jgi:WD40 repeat protein
MIFELVQDFRDVVVAMPVQHVGRGLLAKLLRILEGDAHRLMRYPWTALQQIFNGLLPFRDLPPVSDARDAYRRSLHSRDVPWVELSRVLGPGQHTWRSGFSMRATKFADRVDWFAVLPEGRLMVLTSRFGTHHGQLWLATLSERPQLIGTCLPLTPPKKPYRRDRIATLGHVVAGIDGQGTLRFLEVFGDEVRFVRDAVADAAGVVAWRKGFVVALVDGTLVRFSALGGLEATTEGLGLEEPGSLGVSQDGRYAVLAKALKETSLLRVIDLEQARILADRQVEYLIFRAAPTSIAGNFFLGGMMGFFQWTEPWTDAPKKLATDSVYEITMSPDGRFWALVGGRVIINDLSNGLASTVPVPGGELLPQQTAWSNEGGDVALHLAGGSTIHTHYIKDLHWSKNLQFESIERGVFDRDGKLLVGVGAAGRQFLWNTVTGTLIESYKSGHTYMPYGETYMPHIEWSPSHTRGAVCHIDEIEILDAQCEIECSIAEPHDVPAVAVWDDAGETLAYACSFGRDVRVVVFTGKASTCERYSCDESRIPRAVALSPDGCQLAFVEGVGVAANNLTTVIVRSSLTFTGHIEEGVVLVDRVTKRRRHLLKGHPKHLTYLAFVSDSLLLAADMEGMVMFLDICRGGIVAQWWAPARLVGHSRRVGGILLADSGEGTNHAPNLFEIEVHS